MPTTYRTVATFHLTDGSSVVVHEATPDPDAWFDDAGRIADASALVRFHVTELDRSGTGAIDQRPARVFVTLAAALAAAMILTGWGDGRGDGADWPPTADGSPQYPADA